MVTTTPEYEDIMESDEFNEYLEVCAKLQRLEQDFIIARTAVDLEAGFLPFEDKVI